MRTLFPLVLIALLFTACAISEEEISERQATGNTSGLVFGDADSEASPQQDLQNLMDEVNNPTAGNQDFTYQPVNRFVTNDPFEETAVQSQFFELEGQATDRILKGKDGTLVVIPPDAFIDAQGNPVNANVRIELTEALSVEKMAPSGLFTQSGDRQLETGGMLYINATTEDGEQLAINPDRPLYVEVPTDTMLSNMMLFTGERQANGIVDWQEPEEMENLLIPLPLKDLDFYPGYFDEIALHTASRLLEDYTSSYEENLYEQLYSWDYQVDDPIEVEYGWKSTLLNPDTTHYYKINGGQWKLLTDDAKAEIDVMLKRENADILRPNGISPATLQTITDKRFEGTWIATREFEQRMKYIHAIGDNKVVEIYIDHLNEKLWRADSAVAHYLFDQRHPMEESFYAFSLQKFSRVENGNPYVEQLQEYFHQQKSSEDRKMEALRKKVDAAKAAYESASGNTAASEAKLMAAQEEQIKAKRTYRRDFRSRYGFFVVNPGYINCDRFRTDPTAKPMIVDVMIPEVFIGPETQVFFVSESWRGAIPTKFTSSDEGDVYRLDETIPFTTKGAFVATTSKGKVFYCDMKRVKLSEHYGKLLHLEPSPKDQSHILKMVKSLDWQEEENKGDFVPIPDIEEKLAERPAFIPGNDQQTRSEWFNQLMKDYGALFCVSRGES